MKKIRGLVLATFLGLGALIALAAPASAAGNLTDSAAPPSTQAVSCSGSITYDHTHVDGFGELTIYFNNTNGGTNSACFYHKGAAYGNAALTKVQISRCAETSGEGTFSCTKTASSTIDSGNYEFYAGPRGVTGTANFCVYAWGEITWNGVTYRTESGRQGCPH